MPAWKVPSSIVLLGLMILPGSQASTLGEARLPQPMAAFAWVDTGDHVLMFGGDVGHDTQSAAIVSWEPGRDAAATGDRLPIARWAQAAVWTGKEAWLFGGTDRTKAVDDVVRYVPGAPATVAVRLPQPRDWMSAVWDGASTAACLRGCAYLFGGAQAGHASAEILRFNPDTTTFQVMKAKLPSPRWGTTATWSGSAAYIVGGLDGKLGYTEIMRYDPKTDTLDTVAHLPLPTADAGIAWMDGALYVAGGHVTDERFGRPTLLRWSPDQGLPVATSCLPLLHPVYKEALIAQGSKLWLLGGYEDLALDRVASSAIREIAWSSCPEVAGLPLPNMDIVPAVIAVAAHATEVVQVSPAVSVSWVGKESPSLVSSTVATGEAALQGLEDTGRDLPYANIEANIDGPAQDVKVEFQVEPGTASDLSIYRYDGTGWHEVREGADIGLQGDDSVHVSAAGGTTAGLWAVVDAGGLYAVGKAAASSVPAPKAPGAGPLLLLGIVATAFVVRSRR